MSIKSFAETLAAAFYPNRCAGCGKVIPLKVDWCDECIKDIHRISAPVCTKCGKNMKNCCCRSGQAFNWNAAFAPFYFEGSVRRAIHRFKFKNHPELSEMFAKEMCRAVKNNIHGKNIDLIACVPMTKKREEERGYNQSELLAKGLSKITGITFYSDLLIKVRETEAQHSLSANKRAGNVFGAYAVTPEISVKDKTVLLCDDIKTTGETLAECCRMLRLAGVGEVFCVCAAITDYKEKIDN